MFLADLLEPERVDVLPSMNTQDSNFQVRLNFYSNFQKLVVYC